MLELDLRLKAGDFDLDVRLASSVRRLAVFGPSGAGKSTLLEALAGLRRARGHLRVDGQELNTPWVPAWRRDIGVVFQDGRLFPHLSVRENLAFSGKPVEALIERLELGALLDRQPRSLSGGEARRVALGRALAARPRLLLLDEPLSGLDAPRRAAMIALLLDLDLPMVLVSHNITAVMALGQEVAVLDGGRVKAQGAFFELLGQDGVYRLADEEGLVNVLPLDGELRERLVLPEGSGPLAFVRPEDILLARGPLEALSARNVLRGRVTGLLSLERKVLVTVDIGTEERSVPIRATLTPGAVAELGLGPGVEAWAVIKATAIRFG